MERRSTLSERANLQFFEVFDIKPPIHEYPLLRTVPHSRGPLSRACDREFFHFSIIELCVHLTQVLPLSVNEQPLPPYKPALGFQIPVAGFDFS